jgi:superfamily I DNA and/or RNA helicase
MHSCRRFNVAVTRGMALCVVVGQPRLLYSDLRWRELLKYCVANGTFPTFCRLRYLLTCAQRERPCTSANTAI